MCSNNECRTVPVRTPEEKAEFERASNLHFGIVSIFVGTVGCAVAVSLLMGWATMENVMGVGFAAGFFALACMGVALIFGSVKQNKKA